MSAKGLLFVVSAPSGAGKTTICNKAINFFPTLKTSVSYTTRKPREGEKEGVDYYFTTEEDFENMKKEGEFLEYATVHGNRYGTSAREVNNMFDQGLDILFDIDVQGAQQIKEREEDAVFIFLLPPSLQSCEERLKKRGDLPDGEMLSRLGRARKEVENAHLYDYLVINDTIDKAFEKFKSIIIAEKNKTKRVKSLLDKILEV
jgi:guanylate kinase